MKTSMAYRLFRLYFNSNSENYDLFGSRVHNPVNGKAEKNKDQFIASMIRILLVLITIGAIVAIAVS